MSGGPEDWQRRRGELVALLERRADLLAPPAGLIERVLARADRAADAPAPAEAPARRATGRLATAAEDRAPSRPEAPVSDDLAAAATVPEEAEAPAGGRERHRRVVEAEHAAPGPALAPDAMVAGYRILGLLGAGAMGQVYRAHQVSMNRAVALKVLTPRLAGSESFRRRFLREARNAGRLQHPHLIAVHDVGEADGQLFFSMELIDGRTVSDLIREAGALPEAQARSLAAQVLDALKFAHGNGIVHRDIKPDNIMVTKDGVVKVADLGLSRDEGRKSRGKHATQTGAMMGTPYYMAPEQGRDASQADHRADLYAVGATLYHMVCGQVPFTGRTPVDVLVNAATQPLEFPLPGPSAGMRRVIARLMAKDPAERPQSAEEALALLEASGSVALPHSGRMFADRPAPRRRPRRWWWLLALLLVLAAAGAPVAVALADRAEITALETRCRDLVARGEGRAALAELQRAAQGRPRLAEAVARLEGEVQTAWDALAQEPLARLAAEIERALQASDYEAARATLDRADGDGVLAGPAGRDRRRALADQVRHNEMLALIGKVELNPPEAVTRQDSGHYRLTNDGRGRIPFDRGMPDGAVLRLVLNLVGSGRIFLMARAGEVQQRLELSRDGLVLFQGQMAKNAAGKDVIKEWTEVARRSGTGSALFELTRGAQGGVSLAVPGWDRVLAIDQAEKGFAFQWNLSLGHADLTFEVVRQPGR